jgi:hypothetical protein
MQVFRKNKFGLNNIPPVVYMYALGLIILIIVFIMSRNKTTAPTTTTKPYSATAINNAMTAITDAQSASDSLVEAITNAAVFKIGSYTSNIMSAMAGNAERVAERVATLRAGLVTLQAAITNAQTAATTLANSITSVNIKLSAVNTNVNSTTINELIAATLTLNDDITVANTNTSTLNAHVVP